VSFAGKTIDLILTGAAGGGTDTLGRIFAEYFPQHIPGTPRIAVQNVPGGGGLTGARQGSRAKPDGLTIFIISSGLFRQEALGIDLEGFKTADQTMLGSHAGWDKNTYCLWTRSEVAQSWDDVQKLGRKIKFGSPGAGSNQGLLAAWLSLTDQPVDLVLGYGGSAEVFAAMDRGEIDAHGLDIGRISRAFPEWFKKTPPQVTPILAELDPIDPASFAPYGLKPPPLVLDTVKTSDSNRAAYKLVMDITAAGDVFSLPPKAPADVTATLRQALEETGKDAAYLAAAKQRDFSGGYWAPEYVSSAFDKIKAGTPEQIALIKAMVSG
jgi:tripartite-type tricarboxylate transporter receptor subunit TctC